MERYICPQEGLKFMLTTPTSVTSAFVASFLTFTDHPFL